MRYAILVLLSFMSLNSVAQELLCNVKLATPKLNTTDPAVFQTLQSDLTDFMNSRQWTNKSYGQNEKIECTFNITIVEEVSSTSFKAEVQIQATRPVYNSNYKTMLFQHQDKEFEFEYTQFQPIEYDNNAFVNNLTSMMAFYAYMIIGYDYDSFSKEGGTPHFRKAEAIVNRAQAEAFSGWKPNENNKRRNRYWMVANVLNPRFKGLREAYYSYHLQGLDRMFENADEGRNSILLALKGLEQAHRDNPNTMAIKVFSISKTDEILNIFNEQSVAQAQKSEVRRIMKMVDPANGMRFEPLNQSVNRTTGSSRPNANPRSGSIPKKGKE